MDKSPDAFRTISEVAQSLDLPQHVLRFWETRFVQLKPMKRGGGRRYYRPADVDLVRGIKHLLYDQGYTIKGVQKLLKENGINFIVALADGDMAAVEAVAQKKQAETSNESLHVEEEKSGRKFFGLLKGDDSLPLIGGSNGTSKDTKTLLQEALFELIECKRILDRARQ